MAVKSYMRGAWAAGLVALTGCAAAPGAMTLPVSLPDLTSYALVRTEAGTIAPQVVGVERAAAILAAYDVVIVG
jgi:hypothetical protein